MFYPKDAIDYMPLPFERSEDKLRFLAGTMAAWACTDGTFQSTCETPLASPLYTGITWDLFAASKREHWAQPFSGCAYLCHWVLECLGFGRMPGIGRTGKADNPLARLAWNALSEGLGAEDTVESGDIVQIGEGGGTHVYMAMAGNSSDSGPRNILAANYGQEGAIDKHGTPIGGKVGEYSLKIVAGHQLHGSRRAYRVLRLVRLLEECEKPETMRIPREVHDFLSGYKLEQGSGNESG